MKNIRHKAIVAALFMSAIFYGQELRIPNTPAFSILDHEPASVMRPTSAKKLSTDILNSFDAEGKLIMDYGIEVTPYWLKSRPNLTREEYLRPGFLQTLKQTFTLSAATVKDTITKKNNMGVGLRVQLFKGQLTPDFTEANNKILKIEKILKALTAVKENNADAHSKKEVVDALVAELKNEISDAEIENVKNKALNTDYTSVIMFCNAIRDAYDEDRISVTKKVIELENTRKGFSLEVAAASKFADSDDGNAMQRVGIWTNANYYMSEKDGWTVTARYMKSTRDSTATNFDIGMSYIRIEKAYSVSVEAMLRWNSIESQDTNQAGQSITRIDKNSTYRIAAQMSYSVTDDISFNLSIGKAFDDPVIAETGFFSLFGLNYSIFDRQQRKP